jgi:probable HAF family extracellular repeat protein
VNENGQVAGSSYTNYTPNPTTGVPTFDPFLWEKGTMLDLGTLGGTYGFPNDLNNRGQVVGLSNLAGDLVHHPFLWDGGKMTDLGTFGGDFGQANWINEAGDIVGFAENKDQALLAFLWKDGVLTNLGAVKGEACSAALGINSKSQVVGLSAKTCTFTAADRHASLWENGHVIDLNTFLPPSVDLQQLTDAYNINDRGEIAGLGVPPGCGDEFACGRVFVLIPCDDDQPDEKGCEGEHETATTAIQNSHAPVNSSSANATGGGLTPREIAARMQARFGRNRSFGAWPRKALP